MDLDGVFDVWLCIGEGWCRVVGDGAWMVCLMRGCVLAKDGEVVLLAPLLILYRIGLVPPADNILIDPLFNPLHVTFVGATAAIAGPATLMTFEAVVAEHPF